MKMIALTLSDPGIVGIKDTQFEIFWEEEVPSLVNLRPESGSWGGVFDVEKALLLRPENAPARPALRELAKIIQKRLVSLESTHHAQTMAM